MRKLILPTSILVIAGLVTAGCQRSGNGTDANIVITGGGGTIDTRYLLQEEPSGAKGVLDLRKEAKDGEDIVVVGRVGGRVEPFVKGRTSFTIVDPSLKTCSDIEGDNCSTPWDYCCERPEDLARATVLVKFVDEGGKTLEQDAREVLGIKPLQTVVVRGRAKRDGDGNLTVLASGLHVRAK
jgi:hypothetical protein